MSNFGLGDAALDTLGDQLIEALAAASALVDGANEIAVLVYLVGIDGGEGADAPGSGPGTGALACRYGNSLAAFDEREHFLAGNHDGLKLKRHDRVSYKFPNSFWGK